MGTKEELYEIFKKRLNVKKYTYETFLLQINAGKLLAWEADAIDNNRWGVIGYKKFPIYHPYRIIRAPNILDRVVEQWYSEKYIKPFVEGKLTIGNAANQEGKGSTYALMFVKDIMEHMYKCYRDDWYFYKFDMEKYFDNLRHKKVLELFQGMDEKGYKLIETTLKSYKSQPTQKEAYYARENPSDPSGLPKGNLPSQWAGIVYLNELDHILESCTLGTVRYMDDGWNALPDKDSCRNVDKLVRTYLKDNHMGIRVNERKTYYSSIRKGFTFCGWRFYYDDKGNVHMRVRRETKDIMEHRLKAIKKLVKENKMDRMKARITFDGMINYLKKSPDSKPLIKYLYKHYYM